MKTKYYRLEHWSSKKLSVIEPKYQGSGPLRGAERFRPSRIPRSYYYLAGTKPEVGLGRVKHSVNARLKLFEFDQDTNHIYGDVLEDFLVKNGYDGYYNVLCPEIVCVFVPLAPND